ncbi:MAG: prolyl oligopeptidase family serine peptidase [Phycisphaerales bacterium]|nr:prolyl oligopeptidase family serine peptidase [Phycisphaerales bacterium]
MLLNIPAWGAETFTPYKPAQVPQNARDLWKDYDPCKEALEVKVVKEWKEGGVVCRYVTFKVGTFKGADARIAAYYSFPANRKKSPAFVWSHGGGQRADKRRGLYFAKQGFAVVDINWLGRPMEKDIAENTDWGKVDPTQGPRFYSKALRKGWKRSLKPDEFTIDSVVSPRNNNWFLLAVAARRAITFLQKQPEVDADRIGFSGYSMGGMITSLVATDPRLKAVAPFVGGSAFKHVDFPGYPGTGLSAHYREDVELYKNTLDPCSYWPRVKCPVMFISSSNDFHSVLDRIYKAMALLKHKEWRVSTNIHENHGPGKEQWVLLEKWFDLHLKRIDQKIPTTPRSTLVVKGREATFTVTPENRNGRLTDTEIYYSYDPNARVRFWNRAEARKGSAAGSWTVKLKTCKGLPLYVFALCRYKLDKPASTMNGETSTFTINSLLQSALPRRIDIKAFAALKTQSVIDDFKNGLQDWSSRDGRSIKTYKFRSPRINLDDNKKLCITIDPKGRNLILRLNAESRFLGHGKDLGTFSYTAKVSGSGPKDVIVARQDFKGDTKRKDDKNNKKLSWSGITRFSVTIIDLKTRSHIDLTSQKERGTLKLIKMVEAPAKGKP